MNYCPVYSLLAPSSHSQSTRSEQHSHFSPPVTISVYRGPWSPPVNQPSKFTPLLQTSHRSRITCKLKSDDIIMQELEQLHKSFNDLALDIRKKFNEVVKSGKSSLGDVAMYIEERQTYSIRGLTAVETTDDFFELVRPHYNFLDCRLLETLADKVLDEEDLTSIQQHKRNVLDFKSTSQVESLKSNVKDLSILTDQHEQIVIEIENKPRGPNPRGLLCTHSTL